jgi:hypothetical protein
MRCAARRPTKSALEESTVSTITGLGSMMNS